jgi:hypothetical protein
MAGEVKLNEEKKEQIKGFFEFQLLFFSEGLTAGKSFIKEFCFQIIAPSLKIVSQKLDIRLDPKT